MSSLDLELDARIDDLELEWREAHEAIIAARAECLAFAADLEANAGSIGHARERLRRAEAAEARIFAKMELLEDNLLGLS
jgi:hypothetical protein